MAKTNAPERSNGRHLSDHERLSRTRGLQRAEALRALQQGRPVVYAVRMADGIIKIGCSRNLAQRRRSIGPESEVLGFRFGDEADEAEIHERLAPHRARAIEYYHPTPEVLAVVNGLRSDGAIPLPPLT